MNEQPSSPDKSLFHQAPWKAIAVVLIASLLLAFSVIPTLAHGVMGLAYGDFGFSTGDYLPASTLPIDNVRRGGAADRAGLKTGDVIDMRATPLQYHRDVYWGDSYLPGTVAELHVIRAGRPLEARLISQRAVDEENARYSFLFPLLRVVLMISSGLILLILRPSKMTWGYFVFSLSFLGWSGTEAYLRWDWAIAWRVFGDFLNQAGIVGFLIFALRFPRNVASGWKSRVDAVAPYLLVSVGLLGALSSNPFGPFLNSHLFSAFNNLSLWSIVALVLLAQVALIDTYVHSSGEDRQRLRWVIAGCILGFASYPFKLFGFMQDWVPAGWPTDVVNSVLPMIIPVSILYGVLKHRVIDLRFVMARSLTYVLLAGGFAMFLASVDWLGLRFYSATRMQTIILVSLATVFGLALVPLARLVRNIVDRLYFRAQFDARERLAAQTDAIKRAQSSYEFESILTSGVVAALGLASAAIFWPQGDGGFTRGASCGWPSRSDWHILNGDLAAKRLDILSASRLGSPSALTGFVAPEGLAAPIVAVPLRSNRHLYACLLYGAHANGADINSEEIAELRWLAREAAITWCSITSREVDQFAESGEKVAPELSVAVYKPL